MILQSVICVKENRAQYNVNEISDFGTSWHGFGRWIAILGTSNNGDRPFCRFVGAGPGRRAACYTAAMGMPLTSDRCGLEAYFGISVRAHQRASHPIQPWSTTSSCK